MSACAGSCRARSPGARERLLGSSSVCEITPGRTCARLPRQWRGYYGSRPRRVARSRAFLPSR
jgi:hypothetical protein